MAMQINSWSDWRKQETDERIEELQSQGKFAFLVKHLNPDCVDELFDSIDKSEMFLEYQLKVMRGELGKGSVIFWYENRNFLREKTHYMLLWVEQEKDAVHEMTSFRTGP